MSRNPMPAAALCAALIAAQASAQCASTEHQMILDPDGSAAFDGFGFAAALWGDALLVGETGQDRAHLFRESGGAWVREAVITQTGDDVDFFGQAVAIDGDLAVIGAGAVYTDCNDPDECYTGAAWAFRRVGGVWVQEFKFERPFYLDSFNLFGSSVALRGDNALVAAAESIEGVVVPYEYNGAAWVRLDPMRASDGEEGDSFGRGLAIEGDLAVVGAPNDDDAGGQSGSAYVFRKAGGQWAQVFKLAPNDPGPSKYFGASVAMRGDLIAVGSPGPYNTGAGSVYLFRGNGGAWTQEAKLSPALADAGDAFGARVAIGADGAVLGSAIRDAHAGSSSGAAYVFTRVGGAWTEQARLTASDAGTDHQYGIALAAEGGRAAIGAWQFYGGVGGGAVYLYGGIGDCNGNQTLDLCDVSGGSSQDGNGNGLPDECECRADFDADGDVDTQDVLAFLNAWVARDPGADFNGDGVINTQDVLAFLNAWAADC